MFILATSGQRTGGTTPNIHISDDFACLKLALAHYSMATRSFWRNAIVLVDAQRLRANHVLAPTAVAHAGWQKHTGNC